jgi:hypothetical protein
MKAAGRWAWWNQYIPITIDKCIVRAKEAKLDGVIVKAQYPGVLQLFKDACIRVGVDVYAYPHTAITDADLLVRGIRMGAEFAIINAEHEWEQPDSGEQMRQLCERFREQSPAELYASVDTRGRRMLMPYQQVLSRYITGWMPMIYPKAFRPSMPPGSVTQAFIDCVDVRDFAGKPVLPTIQTYDSIGVAAVTSQIARCFERGFKGYQAYTIGHATDAEWAVIVNDAPRQEEQMPDWLDTTIVDLSGQPLLFNVLQADMSFREESMTYKRWLTLQALGFLEDSHSHKVVWSYQLRDLLNE